MKEAGELTFSDLWRRWDEEVHDSSHSSFRHVNTVTKCLTIHFAPCFSLSLNIALSVHCAFYQFIWVV